MLKTKLTSVCCYVLGMKVAKQFSRCWECDVRVEPSNFRDKERGHRMRTRRTVIASQKTGNRDFYACVKC